MDIPEININTVNREAASWQNKITQHANQNSFGNSKGLLIHQTSDGTIIKSLRKHTINPLLWNYTSEFNQTASYSVDDVCRVMPGVSYGVNATVGTWICVAPVPNKALSDAILSTYGTSSYQQWVRQPNAQYFPQWPESSSVASLDNPVGRYWEKLDLGSGSGGSSTAIYTFSQSFGDYFLAKDAGNNTVQIARIPETRCSITSKVVYGNTFTYTYPHNPPSNVPATHSLAFVFRQASNVTNGNVYESITPAYSYGDEVQAVAGVNTGVFSVGADSSSLSASAITIQEVTNRAWAVNADQNWGIT